MTVVLIVALVTILAAVTSVRFLLFRTFGIVFLAYGVSTASGDGPDVRCFVSELEDIAVGVFRQVRSESAANRLVGAFDVLSP